MLRRSPSFFKRAPREIGDIEFVERIGQGTFGEVWKARNKWTGEPLAVKRAKRKTTLSKLEFLKEAKILRTLRHDNLLHLLAVLVVPEVQSSAVSKNGASAPADPGMYLVTEYCDGGDLATLLSKTEVPLPWPLRVRYALDIARGLQYLHDNYIIHRDLKCENCLLYNPSSPNNRRLSTAQPHPADNRSFQRSISEASAHESDALLDGYCTDRVVLADFGLARWHGVGGERMTICGTPWGMAPELLEIKSKEGYSLASDVFSFGIVLVEIVTRRGAVEVPRMGDFSVDMDEVTKLITPYEQMSPDDGTNGVEEYEKFKAAFLQLVKWCCATDPAGRPTAGEIVEEIEAMIIGIITAKPRMENAPLHEVRLSMELFNDLGKIMGVEEEAAGWEVQERRSEYRLSTSELDRPFSTDTVAYDGEEYEEAFGGAVEDEVGKSGLESEREPRQSEERHEVIGETDVQSATESGVDGQSDNHMEDGMSSDNNLTLENGNVVEPGSNDTGIQPIRAGEQTGMEGLEQHGEDEELSNTGKLSSETKLNTDSATENGTRRASVRSVASESAKSSMIPPTPESQNSVQVEFEGLNMPATKGESGGMSGTESDDTVVDTLEKEIRESAKLLGPEEEAIFLLSAMEDMMLPFNLNVDQISLIRAEARSILEERESLPSTRTSHTQRAPANLNDNSPLNESEQKEEHSSDQSPVRSVGEQQEHSSDESPPGSSTATVPIVGVQHQEERSSDQSPSDNSAHKHSKGSIVPSVGAQHEGTHFADKNSAGGSTSSHPKGKKKQFTARETRVGNRAHRPPTKQTGPAGAASRRHHRSHRAQVVSIDIELERLREQARQMAEQSRPRRRDRSSHYRLRPHSLLRKLESGEEVVLRRYSETRSQMPQGARRASTTAHNPMFNGATHDRGRKANGKMDGTFRRSLSRLVQQVPPQVMNPLAQQGASQRSLNPLAQQGTSQRSLNPLAQQGTSQRSMNPLAQQGASQRSLNRGDSMLQKSTLGRLQSFIPQFFARSGPPPLEKQGSKINLQSYTRTSPRKAQRGNPATPPAGQQYSSNTVPRNLLQQGNQGPLSGELGYPRSPRPNGVQVPIPLPSASNTVPPQTRHDRAHHNGRRYGSQVQTRSEYKGKRISRRQAGAGYSRSAAAEPRPHPKGGSRTMPRKLGDQSRNDRERGQDVDVAGRRGLAIESAGERGPSNERTGGGPRGAGTRPRQIRKNKYDKRRSTSRRPQRSGENNLSNETTETGNRRPQRSGENNLSNDTTERGNGREEDREGRSSPRRAHHFKDDAQVPAGSARRSHATQERSKSRRVSRRAQRKAEQDGSQAVLTMKTIARRFREDEIPESGSNAPQSSVSKSSNKKIRSPSHHRGARPDYVHRTPTARVQGAPPRHFQAPDPRKQHKANRRARKEHFSKAGETNSETADL